MKGTDLFNALGEVRDEYIEKSEPSGPARQKKTKKPHIRAWIIAAAGLALVAAVAIPLIAILNKAPEASSNVPETFTNKASVTNSADNGSTAAKNTESEPTMTETGTDEPEPPKKTRPALSEMVALDDLWKNGELRVYTVRASDASGQPDNEDSAPMATQVSVDRSFTLEGLENVTVDSMLGDRYLLLYRDGFPIFYDLVTKEEIDLSERILKDRAVDGREIGERALERIKEICPKLVEEEINRTFIIYAAYIYAHLDYNGRYYWKTQEIKNDLDMTAVIEENPTLAGENKWYYQYEAFWRIVTPELEAAIDDIVPDKEAKSLLNIRYVDGRIGRCVYTRTADFYGNDSGMLYVYDFLTDTEYALGHIHSGREYVSYSFACDGAYLVVTSPETTPDGLVFMEDETPVYVNYRGETVYLFDVANTDGYMANRLLFGIGKGVLSKNGSVLAVRTFPYDAEVSLWSTYREYVDRFSYIDDGSGQWYFSCTGDYEGFDSDQGFSYDLIIDGAFVRFAADDTVVIMRKDGVYRAYSLIDPEKHEYDPLEYSYDSKDEDWPTGNRARDITDEIKENRYFLYAHEYYDIVFENGVLRRKQYFTGEETVIFENADICVFSEDGAFAFLYSEKEKTAYCYNIATLSYCIVTLDEGFLEALRQEAGATLSLLYNDADRTLTLCFMKNNEAKEKTLSPFYDMVFEALKNAHAGDSRDDADGDAPYDDE